MPSIPDRLNAIERDLAEQRKLIAALVAALAAQLPILQNILEAVAVETEPGSNPASPDLIVLVGRAQQIATVVTTLADQLGQMSH